MGRGYKQVHVVVPSSYTILHYVSMKNILVYSLSTYIQKLIINANMRTMGLQLNKRVHTRPIHHHRNFLHGNNRLSVLYIHHTLYMMFQGFTKL